MASCSSDSSALFYLKLYIGYAGTDKTFSFFNQAIYICSHWGSFLPQGWEVFGLPYSQRLPNHSLAARSSRRAQASLALGPCSLISLSSPMVPLLQLPAMAPLLQLPDRSHGPSKAEHLGRQFLLFRKIACNQGPMRAGFCLFCFHLSWLLLTGPTLGAQLRDAVCMSWCVQSIFAGACAWWDHCSPWLSAGKSSQTLITQGLPPFLAHFTAYCFE